MSSPKPSQDSWAGGSANCKYRFISYIFLKDVRHPADLYSRREGDLFLGKGPPGASVDRIGEN